MFCFKRMFPYASAGLGLLSCTDYVNRHINEDVSLETLRFILYDKPPVVALSLQRDTKPGVRFNLFTQMGIDAPLLVFWS